MDFDNVSGKGTTKKYKRGMECYAYGNMGQYNNGSPYKK